LAGHVSDERHPKKSRNEYGPSEKKIVDFLDFPGRKGGSRVQGGGGCRVSLKIAGSSAFTGLSSYCSLRVGSRLLAMNECEDDPYTNCT